MCGFTSAYKVMQSTDTTAKDMAPRTPKTIAIAAPHITVVTISIYPTTCHALPS